MSTVLNVTDGTPLKTPSLLGPLRTDIGESEAGLLRKRKRPPLG